MVAASTAVAPLVGRREELAALDAALDHARGGEVVTLLVAGEAGIGKSRLVREFTDRAFAQGARLLTGACVDVGDATLPYGALMDALRDLPDDAFAPLEPPLRRALGTLIPEAASDEAPYTGDQRGIFGAVLRLLEQLGREAPLVVVLEDVHWADRSTQDLLRFLVRGLQQTAVLILLTHRTDELDRGAPARRLLADLGREPRVRTLALRPLSRVETAEQLRLLSDGGVRVAVQDVDRIHARSEGNPFFSEQLLAVGVGVGPDGLPGSLREALLARLDRLPATAQRVVRVAAGFGRDVEHELLAAVCELDDEALDAALRACVAGHVLEVDRGRRGFRFRHALLAEVAAEDLLPGEGRRLHRRIADLLAQRPARAGTARAQQLAEIAHHRLRADDPSAALLAAVRAAQAAEEVHAMAEASSGYDAALELWETVPDAEALTGVDLPFLLERAADCRWLGFGDAELSGHLRRRAIAELDDRAPAVRRADYLSRLATTSCYHNLQSTLPLHEEALALVAGEGAGASATAARVRGRYAGVLMLLGDYGRAEEHAVAAVEVARAAGAEAEVEAADARITLAVCRAMAGDPDGALAALDAVRPFALEARDLRVVQRYFTNGSHILTCFGRDEDAVALAREGIALHERAGMDGNASIGVRENAAGALCHLGRTREAAAVLGEDDDGVTGESVCLHIRRAQVAMLQGDLDAAADRATAMRLVPDLEPMVLVPVCALQAEIALWRGDVATALEAVAVAERVLVDGEVMDAAPLLAVTVRTWVEAAQAGAVGTEQARREAARLVARLDAVVGARGGDALPEPALQLRVAEAERSRLAAVGSDGGERAADPEPWRVVAAGWSVLGRRPEEAYANLRLAEALAAAGRGERDELEQAVVAAHAGALAMGCVHVVTAAERLARRARIVLPGAGDGAGAEAEVFPDLTRREREVLGLLVDGATNRQIAAELFITEKTASVHVSNIMGKLGAANRGQAAALAHRAGFARAEDPSRR